MITLGTVNEMYKVESFDEKMKNDIRATLNILDYSYGEYRNYFEVGGFVGIVGTGGDFQKLFSRWKIDLKNEPYEYSINICDYVKKLFITEPDFAIVVYVKEELLQ
ncbi:MAG: hypothetical protein ACI4RC_04410 [Oscillospiraceae bacterium]